MEAAVWYPNWLPTLPLADAALLITGIAVGLVAAMFSVRVALLLVPLALVAASATVKVPAAVAVPEIKPVAALADKPAGKPVTR